MFESFSGETQLVLVFLGIAILFVLVLMNNRHNRNKRLGRKGFRKSYYEKKKKQK